MLSGVIGDTAQRVGEPCTRIDVVELCGDDQAVDGGSVFTAAIRSGEQPDFASDRDAAQRALCCIVGGLPQTLWVCSIHVFFWCGSGKRSTHWRQQCVDIA